MNEQSMAPLSPPVLSTTDQVFRSLYDAVISLRLPPGTKVSETEVAKQLDVSRQPVRDAFFRLSSLGFLLIRPQRATLITRISERAVLDAVFTRTALEVECLRIMMATLADAGVAALRENLEDQQAALTATDPAEFHVVDEAFHELLCHLAGHPQAWALILEHKAHMDRIRFLTLSQDRRKQVLAEHRALVDAIVARDAPLAERRLRAHIAAIRTVIPQISKAFPSYFETDE